MGTITFIKKVHLGSGNYEYTYKCICNNNSSEVKVTSGNDMQAAMLAQLECDDTCGDRTSSDLNTKQLRELLVRAGEPNNSSFNVILRKANQDSYEVSLCTDDIVQVPKKMVKSIELIGLLETNKVTYQIVELKFDTKKNESFLAQQLASILEKITSSREGLTASTRINLKEGETHLQIKIPCSGRACTPAHSYFTSKKPIIQHSLKKVEGCTVFNITKLGNFKLRALHDALGGTICGAGYSGRAYLDIIIAS